MVFLAASLAAPSLAEAAESPWVDLRWSAPEACPSEGDVLRAIDRLLDDSAAKPAAPIRASAAVTRGDAGFEVHLDIAGDSGERARDLRGATCAAIADATALILAMMIDPTAALAAPEEPIEAPGDAPPTAPKDPEEPAPAPPAAPAEKPSDPASAPLDISFRTLVFAGADVGSLPGASGRLGLLFGVVVGDQRFEIGAALAPGSDQTVSGRTDAGGSFSLVTGNVGSCRRLVESPIELSPCLSFELGSLSATGFGVTSPGEGSALWAAAIGGFSASYSLSETVSVASRVEAALPLSRPRFVLDGAGAVHRASAATGRAHLGVELRF